MKDVTFFTLLIDTILGRTKDSVMEFLNYEMMASSFAKDKNLNIVNGCGALDLTDENLHSEYFSKLKRKSTVLIVSPLHVANAVVLDFFIDKEVTFRVIKGDYHIKAKRLKEIWLSEVISQSSNKAIN